MSAPWEIYDSQLFDFYEMNSERELEGRALLQLNARGSIRGNFKFLLDGTETIKTELAVSSIMDSEFADNYRIVIESWPRDVKLKLNSLSSEWLDLEDRYWSSYFIPTSVQIKNLPKILHF